MGKALLGVLTVLVVSSAPVGFAQSAAPNVCNEANTTAVLKIHLRNGACELKEAPEGLRAISGQEVFFVIRGSCGDDDRITIGDFNRNPEHFGPINSVPAANGQVLVVPVKEPARDHYTYSVLVNDKKVAPPGPGAMPGQKPRAENALDVCPVWPCRKGGKAQ